MVRGGAKHAQRGRRYFPRTDSWNMLDGSLPRDRKSRFWNRYLFMLTSLPMFLSGHHTWWIEHIVHHKDMSAKKDFITRRRSFFLVTRKTSPLFVPYALFMLIMQVLRSAVGLTLYVFTCLPALRRMAPEFYDNLEPIRSYTLLGLRFVFAGQETLEDNFNTETHRGSPSRWREASRGSPNSEGGRARSHRPKTSARQSMIPGCWAGRSPDRRRH